MRIQKMFLVILACLFTLPVMAQLGEERRNFAVGVNLGMNMTKVDFNPRIKLDSHNGMALGVTARYMSEKYFKMMCGILAEINYVQRGWKEKIEDGTEDTYSRTMNYVEIPLLAHLAFGKDALDKGMKFFVNMGPQVAYFISDNEKMSEEWNPAYRPNGVNQQYGKAVENKFDYGILGGVGVELSTKVGHFLLEGRYYYGLSDFWGNSKKDDFARSGHNYMGIKLAYLFDITK